MLEGCFGGKRRDVQTLMISPNFVRSQYYYSIRNEKTPLWEPSIAIYILPIEIRAGDHGLPTKDVL